MAASGVAHQTHDALLSVGGGHIGGAVILQDGPVVEDLGGRPTLSQSLEDQHIVVSGERWRSTLPYMIAQQDCIVGGTYLCGLEDCFAVGEDHGRQTGQPLFASRHERPAAHREGEGKRVSSRYDTHPKGGRHA